MPMILRSSAPNTPTSKPLRSRSVTPSLQTPTRKAPQCRKCKRPRAGHPRSGCPFVDESHLTPTRETTAEPENLIVDALRSIHITTPSADNKAEKENGPGRLQSTTRRPGITETRLSLSTTTEEILERLRRQDDGIRLQSNAEQHRNGAARASIVEWQQSVAAAISTETRVDGPSGNPELPDSRMKVIPGTVHTLSPGTIAENRQPRKSRRNIVPPAVQGYPQSSSSPSRGGLVTRASTARPLVRTMSAEDREAFVKSLNRASGATVYVLPKTDILDVQTSADNLGFRTRVVMNDEDESDLQALLILARDEESVERLFGRIEREDREAVSAKRLEQQSMRGVKLKVAAGGAVIGAVGAWAGLAFS
ncbi:hypothetical protein AX17_002128 [Amanita inopinata Kibby_2008]|nr:hypothetical protein AX17_002128 [Amanita inopinata Kibby_2008]